MKGLSIHPARTHELKIKDNYLDDLLSGQKTFELRINDRNYQRGDILQFKRYIIADPHPEIHEFTVLSVFSAMPAFGLKEGWVILSLEKIHD